MVFASDTFYSIIYLFVVEYCIFIVVVFNMFCDNILFNTSCSFATFVIFSDVRVNFGS